MIGPVGSVVRWALVLGGAAAGSYGGRLAAARVRGEPVEPLLRLDRSALLRPDVVPGFMAVELLGRVLKLGPWSAAAVAATGAAAAAFAEGPFVDEFDSQSEPSPGVAEEAPRPVVGEAFDPAAGLELP